MGDKRLQRSEAMNQKNEMKVVLTCGPASLILPQRVGHSIAVHHGRRQVPIYSSENMFGHRLGEFAPTRTFRGHQTSEKAAAA